MLTRTLPKIHSNLVSIFSSHPLYFSTMRKIGKHYIPDLPAYRINPQALRPIVKQQEQFSISQYNLLAGVHKKYRDLQQCRYFAVEFKNKIYHVYNAYHYPMGRMIDDIATKIRGKNTPHYKNCQANVKNGDICVIVNAEDPLFTGKKLLNKNLKYHTGFVGHVKTFSYRAILNKKPELLVSNFLTKYYYLLRKSMPKTKLSEQYLKNLKIYRGPTHDLPNIPQFSPIKFIQNPLTQIDMKKYLEQHPQQFEILYKREQGKTGTVRGEKLKQQSQVSTQTQNKQKTFQPPTQNFSFERETRLANKYSNKKMQTFVNLQKRLRRRYRTVRAPYSKKPAHDPGYRMFYSQKQAMKSPYYQQLADQDMAEEDDEVIEDPLKRKGFDK